MEPLRLPVPSRRKLLCPPSRSTGRSRGSVPRPQQTARTVRRLISPFAYIDRAADAAKSAAESEKEYARLIARWAVGENVDKYSEPFDSEGPPPFALENLALDIKPGTFVAVVGRVRTIYTTAFPSANLTRRQVGSGKSSLLQAVIGEMRDTLIDNWA